MERKEWEIRPKILLRSTEFPVKTRINLQRGLNRKREMLKNPGGGPKLREMTIHERAFKIKFLAKYLLDRKKKYYEISTHTGATKRDSWIDIDGGIITTFGISSQARQNLSDLPWHVEGKQVRLFRKGTFTGQHISGAKTRKSDTHPFKKYFEVLEIGESLTTEKRTITNEDITEFANLTGDHFYAHADDESTKMSMFGERVAHGYLVL